MMIIGDAAHLVNPITGGGIDLAMISGRMAAEVAVEALQKGDVGRRNLSKYQKKWDAQQGKKLKKMFKLQKFTENLTNEDLNKLANILTPKILEELADGNFSGFVKVIVEKIAVPRPFRGDVSKILIFRHKVPGHREFSSSARSLLIGRGCGGFCPRHPSPNSHGLRSDPDDPDPIARDFASPELNIVFPTALDDVELGFRQVRGWPVLTSPAVFFRSG